MKDNVIFWRDWDEAVRTLPDKDQAEAYRAIMDYAMDDVLYAGDNIGIKMLLLFLKPRIDEQTGRYNTVCERNRDNGKKGGRPRKNPTKPKKTQENPLGFSDDVLKPNETQENPLGFSDVNSKPNETQENPIKDKGYKDIRIEDKGKENKDKEKNIPLSGDIPKESRTAFRPPTLDEVINYCREKGYMWDPEYFYDYYTSNGWMVGRTKMKDWRAAMRNWNKKESQQQQKKEYGVYIKRREDSRRETPVADWNNLTPEDMQFRVR